MEYVDFEQQLHEQKYAVTKQEGLNLLMMSSQSLRQYRQFLDR
jgi:hypothetical protein